MQLVTASALSVVHPWGSKIAAGEKTVEGRRWSPALVPLRNLLIVENCRRLGPGESDPDGRAVAVVTIAAVGKWTPQMAEAACSIWVAGWLAWSITDLKPIEHPFRVLAAREIYTVEVDASLLPAGVA